MRRPGTRISFTGWLGLAWVYSGTLWLWGTWAGWYAGAGELALLAFVRAVATVAVGVALCGSERWGWSVALSLCAMHTVLGIGVLTACLWALTARPAGVLSWQAVLWGLTSGESVRLAVAAGVAAAVSIGSAVLLWRDQATFDVPRGRAYGTLVRAGLLPSLLVVLADSLLWVGWSLPH